jgi:translation elongation factor EF-Ts
MHIAATSPQYIPEKWSLRSWRKSDIYDPGLKASRKVIEKIVDGKLQAPFQVCLLEQTYIKDSELTKEVLTP